MLAQLQRTGLNVRETRADSLRVVPRLGQAHPHFILAAFVLRILMQKEQVRPPVLMRERRLPVWSQASGFRVKLVDDDQRLGMEGDLAME